MASGASKAPRPVFSRPPHTYSEVDESAFRREVERFMEAIAESVIDISSLPLHASSHYSDGADPIDHGSIAGLSDDDHAQYYNAARHTKAVHDALALDHGALSGKGDDDHTQYMLADGSRKFTGAVTINAASPNIDFEISGVNKWQFLVGDGSFYIRYNAGGGNAALFTTTYSQIFGALLVSGNLQVDNVIEKTAGAGVNVESVELKDGLVNAQTISAATIHGAFSDDDHTQYHTDARALTWLGTRSTSDLSEGSNLYYTNARVDARIALASIADLATKDHDLLDGLGDDDHTQYVLSAGTRWITGSWGVQGNLTVGKQVASSRQINIEAASGQYRGIALRTNDGTPYLRFYLYLSAVAEGGGDTGSHLHLASYTDTGVYKEEIFSVNRTTGLFTFGPNVRIASAKELQFGSDVNLYRSAANVLKTDDDFYCKEWNTAAGGLSRHIAASDAYVQVGFVSGDSTDSFALTARGKMEWGSGAAARDTNLYRSAANVLKTDDAFSCSTLDLHGGGYDAGEILYMQDSTAVVSLAVAANEVLLGGATPSSGKLTSAYTTGTFPADSHSLDSHTGTLSKSKFEVGPDDTILITRSGAVSWTTLAAADIPSLDTAKITTGTFANARISESSVTQHGLAVFSARDVADVGDVTITAIASGEILKWNGSAWINNTLAEAGISAVGHGHAFSAITGTIDPDQIAPTAVAGDLHYVQDGGAMNRLAIGSAGQILTVSGGFPAWVDHTVPSHSLDSHTGSLSLSKLGGAPAGTQFCADNGAGGWTARVIATADVPNLDTAKITTGTFGIARGGTNASSFTSDYLVYYDGSKLASWVDKDTIPSTSAANSWTAKQTFRVAAGPQIEFREAASGVSYVDVMWDDAAELLHFRGWSSTSDPLGAFYFDMNYSTSNVNLSIDYVNAQVISSSTILSGAQKTDLTDSGDCTIHYHASDRNSANFTGTNWTDLTDGGETTLHKHAASLITAGSFPDTVGITAGKYLQFDGTRAQLAASGSLGGSYNGIRLSTSDAASTAGLAAVVISTSDASGDYPYGTIWLKYTP